MTTAEAEAGDNEAVSDTVEAGAESSATADETPLPYSLAGIGDKTVRKLVDGGFATVEALAAATPEQLSEIPGVGGKTAEKILAAARGDAATPGDATPAAGNGNADL